MLLPYWRKRADQGIDSFLYKYAMLPIAVAYIIGILLAESKGHGWITILTLLPVCLAFAAYKHTFTFLLFIPLGIFMALDEGIPSNHISHFTNKRLAVEGVLINNPENRVTGSRMFLEAKRIDIKGEMTDVVGIVLIYNKGFTPKIIKGNRIRVESIVLKPLDTARNPGAFDEDEYWKRKGVSVKAFNGKEKSISVISKTEFINPVLYKIETARSNYGDFIRQTAPYPESEILAAVTIGDKGAIPYEIRENFSKTGLSHLLSISGLHLAALAVFFYFCLKWLLKRSEYLMLRLIVPRLAAILIIVPLFFYTIVAGFATPVTRAFIISALFLLAMFFGKQAKRLNILSFAALTILAINPKSVLDISFQLSFLSVLGILFIHKVMPFQIHGMRQILISSAKTTIGATIAVMPILINTFGILPILTVPANIVFVPLVEFFIVPLGMLSFTAYLISETLSGYIVYVVVIGVKILLSGAEFISSIPYSSLTAPKFSVFSWVTYILLIANFALSAAYRKSLYIIPITLSIFLLTLIPFDIGVHKESGLKVHFLDSKPRTIILFELPDGETILFNGGYSSSKDNGYVERSILTPYLLEVGITKVNYMYLATNDKGRIAGTESMLQKISFDVILGDGNELSPELWEMIYGGKFRYGDLNNGGLDETIFSKTSGVESKNMKEKFVISRYKQSSVFGILYGNTEFLILDTPSKNVTLSEYDIESLLQGADKKVIYFSGTMMSGDNEFRGLNGLSDVFFITDELKSKRLGFNKNNGGRELEQDIYEIRKRGPLLIVSDGTTFTMKSLLGDN